MRMTGAGATLLRVDRPQIRACHGTSASLQELAHRVGYEHSLESTCRGQRWRIGKPDEVSGAVSYLAGDASNCTGSPCNSMETR
jgi:hypothetical protein